MVRFRYKLAYTDISFTYDIPGGWNIEYAFLRIRDYISNDFDIPNCYEFVCVDDISHRYTGRLEEYYAVDIGLLYGNTINEVYGTRELNTFYIRLLVGNVEDFENINGRISLIN